MKKQFHHLIQFPSVLRVFPGKPEHRPLSQEFFVVAIFKGFWYPLFVDEAYGRDMNTYSL